MSCQCVLKSGANAGSLCKNRSKPGSNYCGIHKNCATHAAAASPARAAARASPMRAPKKSGNTGHGVTVGDVLGLYNTFYVVTKITPTGAKVREIERQVLSKVPLDKGPGSSWDEVTSVPKVPHKAIGPEKLWKAVDYAGEPLAKGLWNGRPLVSREGWSDS